MLFNSLLTLVKEYDLPAQQAMLQTAVMHAAALEWHGYPDMAAARIIETYKRRRRFAPPRKNWS